MRRIIPLLLVCIVTTTATAADNWPPRADEAFIADIYPSRELAERAVKAQLGDDATVIEAKDKLVATSAKSEKGEKPRELTVSFVNKPWAADWSAFRNRAPDNVLIGQSAAPATSEAEADLAAKQAVVAALMPVVRQRLTTGMGGAPSIPDKVVRGVIESHLQHRQMIRDRFVQRFSRPYGDVWYEALLVDTAPSHIDAMVQQANFLEHRAVGRQIGIVLAFLLLLAITTIAYLLINWLTKGYFVWRLRFAAMTMLAIAAMTALAIA